MGVTISLHIEELVLHGFAPNDRHAIAAGVQTELMHLLTERGLPRSLRDADDHARLAPVSFQLSPDSRPQSVGRQIARSIVGGMDQ